MLPVNIVLPADREETALTLNGKKRNLRRKDFLLLAEHCDLSKKNSGKDDTAAHIKDGGFQEPNR